MPPRLSYEQTCQDLFADGLISEVLPLPNRMPHPHDTPWNWSSFKEGWEELDLSNLTLIRTFMGRSSFNRCNFSNTCWQKSRMCWNDFTEVDFSHSDLTGCDLRSSLFMAVRFTHADLSGADLRHSRFTDCDFSDAILVDTKVTKTQAEELRLTEAQYDQVRWYRSPGPPPAGG